KVNHEDPGWAVAMAMLEGSDLTQDLTVEADVALPTNAEASATLVARYTPTAHGGTFYSGAIFTIPANDTYFAEVSKRVDGSLVTGFPVQATLPLQQFRGGPRHLRLEVVGGSAGVTLSLYLDDVFVVSAFDTATPLTTGKVGIRGKLGATFDDF